MKKTFTIIAMALMIASNAKAQTVTGRFVFGYNPTKMALSIPKEFTYNDTPLMILKDNTDENKLLIYDENLNLTKTISLKNDNTFNYQLTCQDMAREVVAVEEIGKTVYYEYSSYEEFIQRETTANPNFNESQLIITTQENGDKIISFDYSYNDYGASNEMMYFAYDYFGKKYPKVYWVLNNGRVTGYRTNYTVTYSEWKVVDTRIENRQKTLKRLRLCNINLNNGDGENDNFFEMSQTLFNEDEKFEYIIPKYELSSKGNGYDIIVSPDPSDETITTTQTEIISENRYLTLTGFQIVSENGEIIKNLNFDSDFTGDIDTYSDYAFVITIGSNTYLAFNGHSDSKSATIFYKIDRSSTDIKQVMKAPASMRLSPTIVNKNAPINISFGDDNQSGSDIVVVSTNGAKVKKLTIPAGQTSAQMYISNNTGVYCVSRVQNNKVTDTRKVIIK